MRAICNTSFTLTSYAISILEDDSFYLVNRKKVSGCLSQRTGLLIVLKGSSFEAS